ncbi:hypothetical protein ACVNB3_004805, partial [Shigella flexneri]
TKGCLIANFATVPLVELNQDAQRMRERIQALEDILDAEHPNWRDR